MYELVDKHGNSTRHRSHDPKDLCEIAASLWPGEQQTTAGDFEDPNGWDIQVCE